METLELQAWRLPQIDSLLTEGRILILPQILVRVLLVLHDGHSGTLVLSYDLVILMTKIGQYAQITRGNQLSDFVQIEVFC